MLKMLMNSENIDKEAVALFVLHNKMRRFA